VQFESKPHAKIGVPQDAPYELRLPAKLGYRDEVPVSMLNIDDLTQDIRRWNQGVRGGHRIPTRNKPVPSGIKNFYRHAMQIETAIRLAENDVAGAEIVK
jgi:hypothetical protein